MNLIDYPSCCGLYILKDFGNTNAAIDSTNYTEEEIDAYLKQYRLNHTGQMVALNSVQIQKIGHIFLANDFVELDKFHYIGHGNDIHILLRKPKLEP
jgi:hypothetical protein